MRISDWISDVCSSDLQPQDPDAALPQDDAADAIVVTGLRASLASAQAIKRNSGQFVDSVTAIDIGKLPDKNVAEALQRISGIRSEEHTSELQSLMRISYAVFCLKKKKTNNKNTNENTTTHTTTYK